jgi:hypothetical protein
VFQLLAHAIKVQQFSSSAVLAQESRAEQSRAEQSRAEQRSRDVLRTTEGSFTIYIFYITHSL